MRSTNEFLFHNKQLYRPFFILNLIIVLGIGLRLYHYSRNPAMWHDEAATTVNVLHKTYLELLGHLDFSATGPVFFLWLQKSVVSILGDGTYALRLTSFLTSCLGLLLLAKLAKQLLDPIATYCATLLAACSDKLLWHASEARHYSSDFLISVVLLFLYIKTHTLALNKKLAIFAFFTPIVIWSSYPGIFLCIGLIAALFFEVRQEKSLRSWGYWILLSGLNILAFACFYYICIRAQRSVEMDSCWAWSFPTLQRPLSLFNWAFKATLDIVYYYVRPSSGLFLGFALIGIIKFWQDEKRRLLLLILIPMGCAMCAALLKSYPYAGARTMVYCLPGLSLLIGAGLSTVVQQVLKFHSKKIVFMLLLIMLYPLVGTLGQAFYRVFIPWNRADTAGASTYVLTHRLSTEPVAANHWEYIYYFRHIGDTYYHDLSIFNENTKASRTWLVLTASDVKDRLEIEQYILAKGWRVIEQHEFQRSSVFLLTPTLTTSIKDMS